MGEGNILVLFNKQKGVFNEFSVGYRGKWDVEERFL